MDLLKFRRELKGDDELGFDLVYVDVGGLSGSDGQLESISLLEALGCALQPRAIVIKSLCRGSWLRGSSFGPISTIGSRQNRTKVTAPSQLRKTIVK